MDGHAHATASIIAAPLVALLVAQQSGSVEAGIGALVGCVAGVAMSPDLDQEGISASEWWLVNKTFGVGWLWVAMWFPYARAFRHRQASHWPVIGTAVRVIYLALLCILAAWLLNVHGATIGWPQVEPRYLTGAFVGLAASDMLHWAMDGGMFARRNRKARNV